MQQQLEEYKSASRSLWASGDYDAMMRQEHLYEVGARCVARAAIGPADEVLDIACGTGNAAIPAAKVGGRVTGIDLTSEMLQVARQRATDAGVEVEWLEGDAEELPFDDERFDVVLSTFGCMFAPRHEVVADEIARVLRRGGRMILCTWTPEGSIGDFFLTAGAYLPPPPDFADPPLLWGNEHTYASCSREPGLISASSGTSGTSDMTPSTLRSSVIQRRSGQRFWRGAWRAMLAAGRNCVGI